MADAVETDRNDVAVNGDNLPSDEDELQDELNKWAQMGLMMVILAMSSENAAHAVSASTALSAPRVVSAVTSCSPGRS